MTLSKAFSYNGAERCTRGFLANWHPATGCLLIAIAENSSKNFAAMNDIVDCLQKECPDKFKSYSVYYNSNLSGFSDVVFEDGTFTQYLIRMNCTTEASARKFATDFYLAYLCQIE